MLSGWSDMISTSHSVHLPEDEATDLKHEVQDKYRILKLYHELFM